MTPAADAARPPSIPSRPSRPPSFVHVTQLSDLIAEARVYPQGVARADLVESLSMGRNAVDRRLRTAVGMKLLVPAGRGVSTGGRAPEIWRFNPDAATILALSIGYRQTTAALMSIGGQVLERVQWDEGIIDDPQEVVSAAVTHLKALQQSAPAERAPWAVGVSIPTSVDFRDGTVIRPVTGHGDGPDWTAVPIRRTLAEALRLSVWVDDEVNTMALAAAMRVGAPKDLLYVRVSLGLGMGIVSNSQVHRGAGAASGEIAHIQIAGSGGSPCRCGRHGCLETLVSGGAAEQAASAPQALRSSSYLREVMNSQGAIFDTDVFQGVARGDRVCVRIATEAADRLAVVLAVLTTTYNPGEVVMGGSVTACGPLFGQVLGQALRRRVLPATSERLSIRMGNADDPLIGACRLAADRVLSPHVMHAWIAEGTPIDVDTLVTHRRQDA